MNRFSIGSFILQKAESHFLLSTFLIAWIFRFLLLAFGFEDYWGDAHHNLIMSKLTLENGFLYSDFKDRHWTWLPLYRYFGSVVMFITGSYSLWIMNISNILIGALTAVLGSHFGSKLLDEKTGLLIGVSISLMPYLMVFSFINMAEMLGGFLLLGWLYVVYKEEYLFVILLAFFASLTRYELTF